MESVWSVSKLSTECVGSRRELVANCVHSHRRRDKTVSSRRRRRCVLGISCQAPLGTLSVELASTHNTLGDVAMVPAAVLPVQHVLNKVNS